MRAVYQMPTSRRKAVLAILGAMILPAWMAWNSFPGLKWHPATFTWWSWLPLVPSLVFLAYGIKAAFNASKPARFELEGRRLTIHAGHGIPDFSGLTKPFAKDASLTLDLSEVHLEWAGSTLNLRTREHGTLPLGSGDAAKPLADWLAANGHPPVKAY